MSDQEIGAAWLKATKEMKAIELEIAGLASEINRTGERLIAVGKVFSATPEEAWNIGTESASDALLKAGEMAKRYKDLLTQRAIKRSELDKFENA